MLAQNTHWPLSELLTMTITDVTEWLKACNNAQKPIS